LESLPAFGSSANYSSLRPTLSPQTPDVHTKTYEFWMNSSSA